MANPDFIEIYDNTLSSSDCESIVELIEDSDLNRGPSGNPPKINLRHKKSWQVPGKFTRFNLGTLPTRLLGSVLTEYVPQYKKKYPCLDKRLKPWEVLNDYNLQKYDPGDGYYIEHCENASIATANRVLVWMVYLNTVTDNGGTYFPHYDRTVDAVEGRLVLWPSYWTHLHKGVVSKKQTKYMATGWFSYT